MLVTASASFLAPIPGIMNLTIYLPTVKKGHPSGYQVMFLSDHLSIRKGDDGSFQFMEDASLGQKVLVAECDKGQKSWIEYPSGIRDFLYFSPHKLKLVIAMEGNKWFVFYVNITGEDGVNRWIAYLSQPGKREINKHGEYCVSVPNLKRDIWQEINLDVPNDFFKGFGQEAVRINNFRIRGCLKLAQIGNS